jgi:hypothetical protein
MSSVPSEATPPPPPIAGAPNRLLLFRVQTCISLLMLAVTLANNALQSQPDSFIKIVAAPFGGLSLAVFVLFLTGVVVTKFNGNRAWSLREIGVAVIIMVAVILGLQVLMVNVLALGSTLSRLLFLYSILFSLVALVYFRVRNLWTMASITGVSEGIVAYLVFFAR